MSRGRPPPWLRDGDDRYWDNIPPPGHSRSGGSKVAGFNVSQEEWDEIFGKSTRSIAKARRERPSVCDQCSKKLGKELIACSDGKFYCCDGCLDVADAKLHRTLGAGDSTNGVGEVFMESGDGRMEGTRR